ncbi:MAG: hypothetical protein KF758_16860 [Anaerolineales bacterium]|nr:hypothetical protein [Anaerolineales bacterium]
MSETYQSKRERWQRLMDTLPVGLRNHVSLRNVEAVAGLPIQAQERLVEAIAAGLKRLPRAIEQLKTNPDTAIADLLNPPIQTKSEPAQQGTQSIVYKEVADLIQQCFPKIPRVSAEALANAEVMEIARTIAQAHHQLFKSKHLHTDFVMMTVYGLLRQTLERLEEMIAASPALQQAIQQGHLPWKPNDWRKQNA